MSALSDRINAANTKGLTSRGIEKRALELGEKVSHGTASTILNGKHGDVSDPVLRALSKVFGIPFGTLRQDCGLPSIDEPWIPPENAARLTHRQRKLVEALIQDLTQPRMREFTELEDAADEVGLSSRTAT